MSREFQTDPSQMSQEELLRELILNRAAIARNERRMAASSVALRASDRLGPIIRCVDQSEHARTAQVITV